MSKYEWIAVLKKAKSLAEGKDETCFKMFGFLLDAMTMCTTCSGYVREEEDEEEEDDMIL